MQASLLDAVYDPALVVLSMSVSALASYVSLDVAARIWSSRGRQRLAWIAAAAVAMGGGIWSMHFIAMLAFMLPVEVHYDVPVTLLSLAIAIAVTAIGFAIVARGQCWRRLLMAGVVMGVGVATMHYTGMVAMHMPAHMSYRPGLFAASIAIACAAATAALWIALRISGVRWRIGAAVVMAVAVAGMHYTGMAATVFSSAMAPASGAGANFGRGTLAIVVAIGTVVILGLELISAAVDRRFAMFRDREAEILRLSARRFRNLVQSSNDLILVIARSGMIEYVAPSSRTAVGREPEELAGRNVFDLLDGAGLDALRAILTAEEERAAFAFADNLRIRDGNGRVQELEATVCNLEDEASVRGIVVTLHDVTERERSIRELRRAKGIADEANRLKSEFIANMNHELRTPLNAILGFSEVIATDQAGRLSPEQYREYAGDIHRSGTQLLAIINDILDLSRAEVGQLAIEEDCVDPERLVVESIRALVPGASKKEIQLAHQANIGPILLRGDARRLRQILLNLLSNALKFTPAGGRITLRVEVSADGEIVFLVEDTGIGIPPDKIDRIVEPFFQVDGSSQRHQDGTGLGLAIANSLAGLHGGRLSFTSEVGKGTTARLILPKTRAIVANAA